MKERLNSDGWEIPDPKPVEVPAGFKRPETLAEQVQRLVRTGLSQAAARQGAETFEEAEDFDVEDDDFDPSTPYEAEFDPVLGREVTPQEFQEKKEYYRQEYMKAHRRYHELQALYERLDGSPAEQKDGPKGPSAAAPEKSGAGA